MAPPIENTNDKLKSLQKRFLYAYAGLGALTIVLYVFLSYGSTFLRKGPHEETVIILAIFMAYSLLPAVVACFAPLWHEAASKALIIVGTINVFITSAVSILIGLSRLDCGDSCSDPAPKAAQIDPLLIVYFIIWVLLPLGAGLYLNHIAQSNKRPTAPDESRLVQRLMSANIGLDLAIIGVAGPFILFILGIGGTHGLEAVALLLPITLPAIDYIMLSSLSRPKIKPQLLSYYATTRSIFVIVIILLFIRHIAETKRYANGTDTAITAALLLLISLTATTIVLLRRTQSKKPSANRK